jgi:two-component system OmpR family sensor kinase
MSLRGRLLLGTGVVLLVLVVAAVSVTRRTEAQLISQIDTQLRGADETGRSGEGHGGPGGGPLTDDGPGGFSSLYVGAVGADGTLQTRVSPNLTGETLAPPDVPVAAVEAASRGETVLMTVGTSGSLRYRALLRPDSRNHEVDVLALPLGDVDAAVRGLIQVEVGATALAAFVLALVTFWVLRLGVRPVKQMTATASAIAAGDLSHRVPDVRPGTEAGELGVALNQMLGRIEDAFDQRTRSEDRLRRFVGDASHELRTPVTTIRGYAELYRAGGLAEESELSEAMRRTEQEAIRMGTLIDDLLLLARLDQGRPLEDGPVDLHALADDAVRDARAVHPDRPITATVESPLTVNGDEGRLRQVLANLVANALVHTPTGTPVEVRARREGDRAVLEVQDHGPGMPADVADKVFERFYRADASRSRHRGGSGLGLSIAKAIVDAHGGEVSLRTAVGQGTTVHLELPAV